MSPVDFSRIDPDSLEFINFLKNNKNNKHIKKLIASLGGINKLLIDLKILSDPPRSYTELQSIFKMPVARLKIKLRNCLKKIHRGLLHPQDDRLILHEVIDSKNLNTSLKNILANYKNKAIIIANLNFLEKLEFSFLDLINEFSAKINKIDFSGYPHFKNVFVLFSENIKDAQELDKNDIKKALLELNTVFHKVLPPRLVNILRALEIYSLIDLKHYSIDNFNRLEGVGGASVKKLKQMMKESDIFKVIEARGELMPPHIYECYYLFKTFKGK